MVGYATEGLIALLMGLTTQQRAAIDRIVEHVYILNQPLAHLFQGDDKICSDANYYRNGEMNPETGAWKRKPGWGKDPAFQSALTEAVRLALQARTREEVHAWAEAKRRARLATPFVVDGMIEIATNSHIYIDEETGEVERLTQDKDRIAAGKALLDYARLDVAATQGGEDAEASEERDWWEAAEDDEES